MTRLVQPSWMTADDPQAPVPARRPEHDLDRHSARSPRSRRQPLRASRSTDLVPLDRQSDNRHRSSVQGDGATAAPPQVHRRRRGRGSPTPSAHRRALASSARAAPTCRSQAVRRRGLSARSSPRSRASSSADRATRPAGIDGGVTRVRAKCMVSHRSADHALRAQTTKPSAPNALFHDGHVDCVISDRYECRR